MEAKHFTNNELWSSQKPKVVDQINKYEEQIKLRKSEIIKEYSEYIKTLNDLYKLSLPLPLDVDEKVTLYIFGFDANQRDGRLKKHILQNASLNNIKKYSKGDYKKVEILSLWKSAKF